MSYRVIVPKSVQKQLDSLPANVRNRVIERLILLAENPRPPGVVKLKAMKTSIASELVTIKCGTRSAIKSLSFYCFTASIGEMFIDDVQVWYLKQSYGQYKYKSTCLTYELFP